MASKNEANKGLIEKINSVEKEQSKTFSNTQKILLTTDGSITAILDVLYGKITLTRQETILHRLSQQEQLSRQKKFLLKEEKKSLTRLNLILNTTLRMKV